MSRIVFGALLVAGTIAILFVPVMSAATALALLGTMFVAVLGTGCLLIGDGVDRIRAARR